MIFDSTEDFIFIQGSTYTFDGQIVFSFTKGLYIGVRDRIITNALLFKMNSDRMISIVNQVILKKLEDFYARSPRRKNELIGHGIVSTYWVFVFYKILFFTFSKLNQGNFNLTLINLIIPIFILFINQFINTIL